MEIPPPLNDYMEQTGLAEPEAMPGWVQLLSAWKKLTQAERDEILGVDNENSNV